jgi:hypothetical protein
MTRIGGSTSVKDKPCHPATHSTAMMAQHCLLRCPELRNVVCLGSHSPTTISSADVRNQPIITAFAQARYSDVTFAQISRSGRAQMLSLPKEGRPNLSKGNRTSNRTQRGKDRSRRGAQRPRHETCFLAYTGSRAAMARFKRRFCDTRRSLCSSLNSQYP